MLIVWMGRKTSKGNYLEKKKEINSVIVRHLSPLKVELDLTKKILISVISENMNFRGVRHSSFRLTLVRRMLF